MNIKESLAAKKQQEQDEINKALDYVNLFIRDYLPEIIKVHTKKEFDEFRRRIVGELNYIHNYKTGFSFKNFVLRRYAEKKIRVQVNKYDYNKEGERFFNCLNILGGKVRGFANWTTEYMDGSEYSINIEELSGSCKTYRFPEFTATKLGERLKAIFYAEAVECAKSDDFIIKQKKDGLITVRYYF